MTITDGRGQSQATEPIQAGKISASEKHQPRANFACLLTGA
jgi:hypothetical protein